MTTIIPQVSSILISKRRFPHEYIKDLTTHNYHVDMMDASLSVDRGIPQVQNVLDDELFNFIYIELLKAGTDLFAASHFA